MIRRLPTCGSSSPPRVAVERCAEKVEEIVRGELSKLLFVWQELMSASTATP
jgi:hypothetical protein